MKIEKGCEVIMKKESGCIGYGNVQCISNVCEPLMEISLYGHNQQYKITDVDKIISCPLSCKKLIKEIKKLERDARLEISIWSISKNRDHANGFNEALKEVQTKIKELKV